MDNPQQPPIALSARSAKTYKAGGNQPAKEALKGIDWTFRAALFSACLGPMGRANRPLSIFCRAGHQIGGSANIWGFDIDANPRQARASIGIVPQELSIDPFFTPAEIMELQAGLYGVPRKQRRTNEILSAMGLADKAQAYARTLSGGMRRRLLVAKAMVHNRRFWFWTNRRQASISKCVASYGIMLST